MQLKGQKPDIITFNNHADFTATQVNCLLQDYTGYIWIATKQGLFRYDGSRFNRITKAPEIENHQIRSLHQTTDSSLWIIARDGTTWRKKGNHFFLQKSKEQYPKSKKAPIHNSFKVKKDTVSFITFDLYKYSFLKDQLIAKKQISYTDAAFDIVKKMNKTWQKPIAMYLQMNSAQIIQNKKFRPGALHFFQNKDSAIFSIGNLIITAKKYDVSHKFCKNPVTAFARVKNIKLSGIFNKGLVLEQNKTKPDTILKNRYITSLLTDQNKGVWIGTYQNGLFYIRNIFTHIYPQSNANILFSDGIKIDSTIIASAQSGEIMKFNPVVNQFTTLTKLPHTIRHLEKIDKKLFLAAGLSNISLLSLEKDSIVSQKHIINNNDHINDIRSSQNKIFTIGDQGIYEFDMTNNTIKHILPGEHIQSIAFKNNNLLACNKNAIWKISKHGKAEKVQTNGATYLYTSQYKIFIIDKNNKIQVMNQNFDTLQTWPVANRVNSINKNGNRLLISTSNGVLIITTHTHQKQSKSFTYKHGLPDNMVLKTILHQEKLFCFHRNKISRININQSLNNTPQKQIQVISPDAQYISNQHFSISVPPEQPYIKLQFSTFQYNTKKTTLYYRTTSNDYKIFKSQTDIVLANLNSGDTQLQICTDSLFNESSNMATINVEREKHWYQQLWLRLMALLLLAALSILIIREQLRRIKRKHKLENTRISQMQTILQQQMNPHFIFNSLTSINHFILQNEPMESSRYLTKFSTLIRNILDNSKKHLISVAEEIEVLENYLDLEMLRFKDRFAYSIKIDPHVDKNRLQIPPFILQPYAERALREGIINKPQKGNILIKFALKKRKLHCTINDDGIGRKAVKKIQQHNENSHAKSGTHLVKQRIDIYNALNRQKISLHTKDLKDHDNNALGTQVNLIFPLNYR